ncbi:uncharacterized protein RSE6_11327 [Rhynchosporium secalis]|nr:uncharacterized protein RSE6_11327 [Rhynchosporium secalis]
MTATYLVLHATEDVLSLLKGQPAPSIPCKTPDRSPTPPPVVNATLIKAHVQQVRTGHA